MSHTTTSSLAPTRVRFGVLGFICSLSVLTYFDRACISRVQGDIQRDLHLSDFQMGVIFSAFLWGYTLFEVPGGRMGDRWGSRRVLGRIVLWWSLFTALTGSVRYFNWNIAALWGGEPAVFFLADTHFAFPVFGSFMLLMLVRFLFGCGEAGAYPNLARVVGVWFPYRERGLAQGSVWLTARLGAAISFVLFGLLSELLGWRGAFWVLGVIGAVWVIAFLSWFRERPEDKPECNAAERELIRGGEHSWRAEDAADAHRPVPWRRILRSPNMWLICVASFTISFGWYFYMTWQPRYLKDVFNADYSQSAIISGLPFAFGAVGCLLGGWLSDRIIRRSGNRRWGRALFGLVGYAGAGTCVLLTGFVTEKVHAVALLCAASFINDLAVPVIWSLPADIAPGHAGTVAGVMNMVGGFGGMLIPMLIPALRAAFPDDWSNAQQWAGVFVVMASAWFIGALAWLGIDASKPLFNDR